MSKFTERLNPVSTEFLTTLYLLRGYDQSRLNKITSRLSDRLIALGDANRQTENLYNKETDYLNALLQIRYAPDSLLHHDANENNPDSLWRASLITLPKDIALSAYFVCRSAQITAMKGDVPVGYDGQSLHDKLIAEYPKDPRLLEGFKFMQTLFGPHAVLRLLAEAIELPKVPEPTSLLDQVRELALPRVLHGVDTGAFIRAGYGKYDESHFFESNTAKTRWIAGVFDGPDSVMAQQFVRQTLSQAEDLSTQDMLTGVVLPLDRLLVEKGTGQTSGAFYELSFSKKLNCYRIILGKAGNCRAYLWQDQAQSLIQLTKDESPVDDLVDENDIPKEGGQEICSKYWYRTDNAFGQSPLGPDRFIVEEGKNAAEFLAKPGDTTILATIGIRNLTRTDIEDLVKSARAQRYSGEAIAKHLGLNAYMVAAQTPQWDRPSKNLRGRMKNITIVAAVLGKPH